MHFPGNKKNWGKIKKWAYFPLLFCLFGLIFGQKVKKKNQKKNRAPSILGLRLKVTVFLLIFAYLLKLLFYYL